MLTHKAARLNVVVEQLLVFFAMLNGSGTPVTWVANHRKHHSTSDTHRDISSPTHGGFWWAQMRWLWQSTQASPAQYCPELAATPRMRIWSRLQAPIHMLSLFGPLVFGVEAWLWLGPLRLLYALHGQCTVNSFCHLASDLTGKDRSKNVAWLAPFFFFLGENWHKNHHDRQASARFGLGWQLDLGWRVLVALERVGLAQAVRSRR